MTVAFLAGTIDLVFEAFMMPDGGTFFVEKKMMNDDSIVNFLKK